MTLLQIQDAITAKVNELPQDVYEDGIFEETKLRFNADGVLLPYIIVEHAGVTPSAQGMPISGIKGASGQSSVSILCIAPTARASRQVAEVVRSKLTGFLTAGAGELVPDSAPFTYIDGNAKPIRYVTETVFSFITDTVW